MSACKCKIPYSCNCQKVPEVCECPISISCLCEKEIPTLELKFVYFQRNLRKSLIGVIDVKETKKIDKRHLRKLTGRKRSNIQFTSQPSTSKNVKMEFSSSDEVDDEMDENYEESEPETGIKPPWQMRIKLKSTALSCDRFGVSDRAAAAIASSVLKDVGIVTNDDHSHVIDNFTSSTSYQ